MGSLLMTSWKTWLLIAAGTLTGLVAGAGFGRYVLNVPTTPVESASQATEDNAANNASRFDNAGHKVTFVTVEPGVELEVLDWGGTGEAMVLLAGVGDNAHVYDQFAHQFTDRFHVIGITRRGFGRSSQPAHGYDLETRARRHRSPGQTARHQPLRVHRRGRVGRSGNAEVLVRRLKATTTGS